MSSIKNWKFGWLSEDVFTLPADNQSVSKRLVPSTNRVNLHDGTVMPKCD